MESSMNKIARGAAVFSDEFVEAMAAGKDVKLPKNLDDIVVDCGSDDNDEMKTTPKKTTKKVMKCSYEELEEMSDNNKLCPKCDQRDVFALWGDATHHSDGELNHFNVKCQGTESSPCSYCSDDEKPGHKTPSPTPKEKTTELAQAKGFNVADFEGEEEMPEKKAPHGPDICKWCHRDPCLVDDEEVREEGKVVVDNLNAQATAGTELESNNCRFALCRMHARVLGFTGKRHLLPVCVQAHVDKCFVAKDEKRTGFKAHKQNAISGFRRE